MRTGKEQMLLKMSKCPDSLFAAELADLSEILLLSFVDRFYLSSRFLRRPILEMGNVHAVFFCAVDHQSVLKA